MKAIIVIVLISHGLCEGGGGGSGGTVTLEINADLLPVTSICREEVTRNACTHRVRGQLISYCNEGTGALRSLH